MLSQLFLGFPKLSRVLIEGRDYGINFPSKI